MLYRTYRPQTFSQVSGQEPIVRTLSGALASGRIGHAYLFAGPRGTGKTTIARIFAKALNCVNRGKDGDPCDACDRCLAVTQGRSLDLVEIDGASNGRVDEIRELKDSAAIAAPSGGYKVFLIDEVHMVSTSGFNALLKMLEEPPARVVFILATTDPHKIPATIISRVQRFDFRRLSGKTILEKLTAIAAAEKARIDPAGLAEIAARADGSLRDAEVALTKVISGVPSGAPVTLEDVHFSLGLIPLRYYPEFFGYLADNNRPAAMGLIQALADDGINFEHFARDFLDYLRRVLVTKAHPGTLASAGHDAGEAMETIAVYAARLDMPALVRLVKIFTDARNNLKYSPIPQLPLELAIIEVTA